MTLLLRYLRPWTSQVFTCLVVPEARILAGARRIGTGVVARQSNDTGTDKKPIDAADKVWSEQSQQSEGEHEMNDVGADRSPEEYPALIYDRKHQDSKLFNGVRYDQLPIVAITSTRNNTFVIGQDGTGKILGRESSGTVGFKNKKQSSTVAAQTVGLVLAQKIFRKGVTSVRVTMDGVGYGKLPALKGLQLGGVTLISLTDKTMSYTFQRPRKAKKNKR